jgi:hypothetical protein
MTTRRILLFLSILAAAALACAGPASASSKAPVIKKISPLRLKVGQKLTITGKNFLPGKHKSKVFFLRVGKPGAVWVRADKGTKTKLTVTVPSTLQKLLPTDGSAARFQLRVLTKRFGSPSKSSRSPLISGTPGAGGGGAGSAGVTGPSTGTTGCTPNFNDPNADTDGDLLPDVLEHQIGTDPCNKDTDGDGVEDGYEYYSAKDLNSNAVPYPAKRPYPNPLFADSGTDYDGDGLTLGDEYTLWITYGGHALPLNYSDGKQTTVPTPAPAGDCSTTLGWALDWNCDGQLNDGERDADGDGLSNWDESHGPLMGQSWWDAQSDTKTEKAYPVAFAGTSMTDPDTDGDGIPDGLDDQDHDGYNNEFESHRPSNWAITYVSSFFGYIPGQNDGNNWTGAPNGFGTLAGGADPYARVNPFNPCKPLWSSICHLHPPAGYYPDSEDWAAPTQDEVVAAGASLPGATP